MHSGIIIAVFVVINLTLLPPNCIENRGIKTQDAWCPSV